MAQTTQPQQPIVIETVAQTLEAVAYQLMLLIAGVEGVHFQPAMGTNPAHPRTGGPTRATKQWIFDTYAECLKATKGP